MSSLLSGLPRTREAVPIAPGAVWLKNWLSLDEQSALVTRCRAVMDGPAGGYVRSINSTVGNNGTVNVTPYAVGPIGPVTRNGLRLAAPSILGTTPGEGLKPTTPQNAAGVRRLPP